VADDREVNAEVDIGVSPEQPYRLGSTRAGNHQARGADDALLERANDRLIGDPVHPKIVGVDQQQARIVWIP
jgi:hypothetical protein